MNAGSREHLLSELAVDEGCVLYAYEDSLGYLTIGYGRLIDRRRGGSISPAEARLLLNNDVERIWNGLTKRFPWIEELDDVRQVVLANLAFNLGIDGLAQFKNTLAAVERGDYGIAAAGMRQSLWFRQVQSSRSERLIRMMRNGTFDEVSG